MPITKHTVHITAQILIILILLAFFILKNMPNSSITGLLGSILKYCPVVLLYLEYC